MSMITPDETPSGLTVCITSLETQLRDMREDLAEIYEQIRAGEFDQLKNASKATTEIRQWLKIALEAEAQLATRNKRAKGIVNDYALDLEEARNQIGGRLARLRGRGDTESVSG